MIKMMEPTYSSHGDLPVRYQKKTYPPVIKHGVLENGPFSSVMFLARNLHLVRGFSSQPCLLTPEGKYQHQHTHPLVMANIAIENGQ